MNSVRLSARSWCWFVLALAAGTASGAGPSGARAASFAHAGLVMTFDSRTGLPDQIQTRVNGASRGWLTGPVSLRVRNLVTSTTAEFAGAADQGGLPGEPFQWEGGSRALALRASQRWSATAQGMAWDLEFYGEGPRAEHQVTIELPALSPTLRVFTPSERGLMQLAAYPRFKPSPYGAVGWETGQCYVLPLISLLDSQSDQALTVALPADANIPHLQFEWRDARVLTLTLARRGMGGGRSSALRLLLYAHPADYRSALKAYSEAFPAWFKTSASRAAGEGAFYYHHIQDHPDFPEMRRQDVRYLWSSFWFTHLGEYLPDAPEWEPYTYAKWWKLGQTMSDDRIRSFIDGFRQQGIRTFAYFNLTEYGGAGGKSGDSAEAAKTLRERFANALIKDAQGRDIPTWEGAMAMNPGRGYALWPFLEDQVRRHLRRLPGLEGFVIDRLDWASLLDYGHDDGLSMVGTRPVENMAVPVREAVRAVAGLAHAANLKVYLNQFYRVEALEDADGACHENDYLPGLGYLTPLRPASAWHHARPYDGDLLQFEAQLKRRLQWAIFPQMIAHEFPIAQQAPNPRAADFLELYAPLFDTLLGKEQVLLPHCVEVTGANDANLFLTPAGYVAPITSRVRFLSRRSFDTEEVELVLRVPDAGELKWAQALAAEGPVSPVAVQHQAGLARIRLPAHGTATMVVAGKGAEPALTAKSTRRLEGLFGIPTPGPPPGHRPEMRADDHFLFRVIGKQVGTPGPIEVSVGQASLGMFMATNARAKVPWTPSSPPEDPPQITFTPADEGTWFVPERIELLSSRDGRQGRRLGLWQPGMGVTSKGPSGGFCLRLVWNEARLTLSAARFLGRGGLSQGRWQGQLGSVAAWIPGVTGAESGQNGWRLEVQTGRAYHWPPATEVDPRVLLPPAGSEPVPSCWFADDHLSLHLVAPHEKPYRLALYFLDYDRNGRAMRVALGDDVADLDTQRVPTAESAQGVCLRWAARGSIHIEIRKEAGFNTVLSGVFVDPEPGDEKPL